MTLRQRCLEAALCCLVLLSLSASAIAQQASQAPSQNPSQPPAKPAEQRKQNPFERVPGNVPVEAAKPAPVEKLPTPTPEAAKSAAKEKAEAAAVPDVVEYIEFRGARRMSQDALRNLIFTRKGDKLDQEVLHRDFLALWNTGKFDDISLEREPGKTGWILRFLVTERRVIRSIKYDGNKSITVSEILDRFKERKVGLAVEQQYEQGKVQRATNVLKEFLSERGRQFATVTPEIRQIPPSSIEVTFKIQEGAKVKVGRIEILSNKVYQDRAVIRAMKNLRPVGIPYSIYFEHLFARTYDASKLEEDKERIRAFYANHGYFMARVVDSSVKLRTTGGNQSVLPPFKPTKLGKSADIKLTMDEGVLYRLNNINFVGVKLFKTPEVFMRPIFGMAKGDIFSFDKLQKGTKQLTKLYGEFGFIDAVPEPDFNPLPDGKLDLTISVDEGKQFFVRRIDFQGNTTTRDKVIRRELLIDEGDMYNTRLWELSVLRLNQLGYFEALKENEAATINRDTRNNTVDITVKVKERGKNSITLNGGVSGISGTFVGFGYATNNFLGLGETLSLSTELGTRLRNVTLGFTEPYMFDRPISAGFTVYTQRFNYNQAREYSLYSGRNLTSLYEALGGDNILNYTTNGYGATVFMSYPLRRTFARVGLTYGFDRSTIHPKNNGTQTYFDYTNFMNLAGANQLSGIITSKLTASYTYNTVDHPITPSRGKSYFFALGFAGSVLGGNVNQIEPTVTYTHFRRGFSPKHVMGWRALGRFVVGYGGRAPAPYNRIYMGGENDVRGFEIWSILPFAYIPSSQQSPVLNPDGSARVEKTVVDGAYVNTMVYMKIPAYQLISPGGDTQGVFNYEYRIPIVGPLILAYFADAGFNRVTFRKQLRLNADRMNELAEAFPYAGYSNQVRVIGASQKPRVSTGLELQIMMPVVNAPFRLYWAYNPMIVNDEFDPPVAFNPGMFPNAATYKYAKQHFGNSINYYEKRTMFRFTISRTF
jgi:outer membrane protein insertion porin family